MTIQQANEYFASLSDGFANVEDVRKAVSVDTPNLRFIGIAGTAGKTAVATMTAAILNAANFRTGRYAAGTSALYTRLTVEEQPLDETIYTAVAEKLAQQEELPAPAAELVAACLCFAQAGCAYAVVELPDAALAGALPDMPACAVTHIGSDGSSHSIERLAHLAAGVMRKGTLCVTAPDQNKAALSEIIVSAGKCDCELVVPDVEDLTFPEAKKFAAMINYGGYETALSFIGHYAACNAAIAVELALGLCNKGIQIEDEAILAGLAAAENRSSIRILCRRPLLILDACHTPQQVRALTNVLRKAKLEHLSAVVGLSDDAGCDAFFAALETGFLDEDKDTEKNRMPGMADNPFDKVYLVTPPACTPAQAKRIAEKAKFHFDITVCETLADAAQQARADKNHGVLICGGEEIVRMAEDLLQ